jgi:hypothetical protein
MLFTSLRCSKKSVPLIHVSCVNFQEIAPCQTRNKSLDSESRSAFVEPELRLHMYLPTSDAKRDLRPFRKFETVTSNSKWPALDPSSTIGPPRERNSPAGFKRCRSFGSIFVFAPLSSNTALYLRGLL